MLFQCNTCWKFQRVTEPLVINVSGCYCSSGSIFVLRLHPHPLHIWRSGYATVLDKMLDWNTKVPCIKWNGFFHGSFIYCKILEKWINWRKVRQTQVFENFILQVPSFLFHTFAPQILGIFFWKVLVCQKLSSSLISKEVPRKIRYYYILFSCQNFIYRKIFFLCVCVTVPFFQTHPWRINKKEIWASSMTVAIFLCFIIFILVFNNIL